MRDAPRRTALFLAALLVASCTATAPSPSPSSSSSAAETGAEDAEAPESTADLTPFSEAEVRALFVRLDCIACHNARNDGPDMSSVAKLVNAPSGARRASPCRSSRFPVLLAPGDHEASLLFRKVAGTQDCGSTMPQGGARRFTDRELARFALFIDGLR